MRRLSVFLVLIFVLTACSVAGDPPVEMPTQSLEAVDSAQEATMTPFQPATFTPTLLPTETPTLTQSPTWTLTPTETPLPTLTPTWVYHEPGQVEVPILLYHHVEGEVSYSRYYVSVPAFRAQMQALRDWGYTAVTMEMVLDALIYGGELPPKPVVITFDDGNLNIYENAFPIMEEYGFPGVFYIVANRLNSGANIAQVPQLKEMLAAGWEIGSHSFTHSDLTLDHSIARYEILDSKMAIEDALGIKVTTFAYPFGTIDPYLAQKVQDYGYRGGMGLGASYTHTWGTMLYLSRMEVQGHYTVNDLAGMLPWKSGAQ